MYAQEVNIEYIETFAAHFTSHNDTLFRAINGVIRMWIIRERTRWSLNPERHYARGNDPASVKSAFVYRAGALLRV